MSELKERLSLEEWRARRAARREKQRAANFLRARKMHAARMAVDRSIPSPAPPPAPLGSSRPFHVGCSGWFYWHWRHRFYPSDLPTKNWFQHYADHFDTVELNAPFYSWPTLANVQSWIKQAGRRKFVYTVKVCELITHVKRFAGTRTLIKDFAYIADVLGPRMGCFLFQLPPSFHYTPARLRTILAQLDPRHRNVIEFRHRTWWNNSVYKSFRDANAIFCSCSGPRLPDELIQTADDVYIRFHGTKRWYRHDYAEEELAIWSKRIHQGRAKRVWAYFNNDRDCHAIQNAKAFLRQLCGK